MVPPLAYTHQINQTNKTGYLSDRHGARLVTFTCFLLISIPLACLRFVTHNTTPDKTLLIILLTLIGLLLNSSVPALFVETQVVLDEMERATPGIFGPRGAVAQAFGIQTMAQFLGMFLGPAWGGFMSYRFGWKVMVVSLGVLAGVTAVPTLWLSSGSSSSSHDSHEEVDEEDEEREALLARA